jgi:hypothetical protein
LLLIASVMAASSQASSGIVGYFQFNSKSCEGFVCLQEAPGFFANANAAAVNADGTGGASAGDIYVLDQGGSGSGGRIQQFSTTSDFIRLWGPGVVKSGPGNSDETQAVRVDATGGAFKLGFGADTTADIPATATAAQVEAALTGLESIGPGGVSVSGGPGNAGGTTPYLVSFDGGALAGTDQPVLKAVSGGAPLSGGGAAVSVYTTSRGGDGFEICQPAVGDECTYSAGGNGLRGDLFLSNDLAIDQATGDLYVTNQNRLERYSATGQFLRAWGSDVVASGPDDSAAPDEQQSVTVKATGGTFTLGYPSNCACTQTTAQIPFDAPAAVVQAALNTLSTIGGSYGSVTVTEGPGDAGGSSPYVVTFHGVLGGDDLAQMTATANGLLGAEKSATVNTVANGGGYEVCKPDDACKTGREEDTPGALALLTYASSIAVAPVGTPNAGDVILGDGNRSRVQEFTADGAFVRAFGWDVDATQPSTGFEVCTAASGDSCKTGTSGAGIGQLARPNGSTLSGVAEDATGAIYTSEDTGSYQSTGLGDRVQKFTPAGGLDLTPSLFGTTEVQAVTVNAGAGQFRLTLGAKENGSEGTGNVTSGSAVITNVQVTKGAFFIGQPIGSNSGIERENYSIVAVNSAAHTITLNQPVSFDQTGLTVRSDLPYTTANLTYNATAGEVQSALNALPSISAGGGSVSVSEGPGDVTGSSPYLVSFDGGPLARTDSPQISVSSGGTPLSGGSGAGANTASVATATPGGPGGIGVEESPIDIGTGPGNHVFVAKYFPQNFTKCANGLPQPAGTLIEELDSNGVVLGTSEPCTGLSAINVSADRSPALTVNPTTGHPYLLAAPRFVRTRLNVFGPPGASPDLTLESVSKITASGGTISGTVNPNGPGTGYPETTGNPSTTRTTYRVEYRKSSESTWTKYSPDIPIGGGVSPVSFSVGVGGLSPKTPYELKVVAVKPFTGRVEETKTFTTLPAAPEIEALSSSGVTATSADLHAVVNPEGTETTYHFEYGTTPTYGNSTPDTNIGESLEGQPVLDHIEGLQDVTYHFRVVATNAIATTASADQTFTFHPPICPNQTVRQQTGSAYLPDCRGYELVSPEDAGGTTLFTGGPQSPYASSPPRLAFVGQFAAIPGSGSNPINNAGDLYVATRGASGWNTRYIGPSSTEAGCVGGRPIVDGTGTPTTIQNDVMADPGLNRVIDWNLGNPLECFSGWFGDLRLSNLNTAAKGSNAPYLWNADGDLLDRWPTAAADTAGAEANFSCPQDPSIHPYPQGFFNNIPVPYFCSTYVTASKDLNHFVFSTQSGLFGEGGSTAAPGSAYDNDTANNTLRLISKLPNGEPIPQEPGGKAGPEELIQFPAVSADGSHILMGTGTKAACKQLDYPHGPSDPKEERRTCPVITQPTHLYMRVNDVVTYDVSGGQAVKYVGSTPDGARVYFTTAAQLTGDDSDTGVDLYMWSENGGSPQLTRISTGEPDPSGNSNDCFSTWTTNCDVKTYDDSTITAAPGNRGGLGGWNPDNPNPGYTDNAIAAKSGDIYFYSPEQLVPGKGAPGKENLYVYREGSVREVAALDDDRYCIEQAPVDLRWTVCSNGAVGRLQVTPDGRYAAFITTSRITAYDNNGYAEMYRYDAETERIRCVSCRPDGAAASGDVLGSEGGRFITDDGRVFFNTPEPLDPRDTNTGDGPYGEVEGFDVYEFVDGKPQLITTGTGTGGAALGFSSESVPGLYGVSADGVDAYFGTFERLVGQDRNGQQLKFYDARTNGGFSFNPPAAPCAAADECHGATSTAPAAIGNGTGAALGAGGNSHASPKRKHHRRKHHKRHKANPRRAAHRHAGGTR